MRQITVTVRDEWDAAAQFTGRTPEAEISDLQAQSIEASRNARLQASIVEAVKLDSAAQERIIAALKTAVDEEKPKGLDVEEAVGARASVMSRIRQMLGL